MLQVTANALRQQVTNNEGLSHRLFTMYCSLLDLSEFCTLTSFSFNYTISMSVEMCFSYIGQFNFILSLLGSIPRVFQQIIPIPDQSVYVITGQYLACIPTDSPDTTRPVCLCDYWAVSRRYSNRSS